MLRSISSSGPRFEGGGIVTELIARLPVVYAAAVLLVAAPVSGREAADRPAPEEVDILVVVRIRLEISGDRRLRGLPIEVEADRHGLVILRGVVPAENLRARLVEIALDTPGVDQVSDLLQVGRPKPEGRRPTLAGQSHPAWLGER